MKQNFIVTPCAKTSKQKQILDHKAALIYLKLRNYECKPKNALNYAQRHHCKLDSTSTIQGPCSCRILKPKVNIKDKYNILNGWLMNVSQDYDMGKKFITNKDQDVLKVDQIDEKIKIALENQNNAKKQEFNKRQIYHKIYMQEMEEKYNFSSMDKKKLSEKLTQLKQIKDKRNISNECYNIKDLQDIDLFEIRQHLNSQEKSFKHPIGQYPYIFSEAQAKNITKTEFVPFIHQNIGEKRMLDNEKMKDLINKFQQNKNTKQSQIQAEKQLFNQQYFLIPEVTEDNFMKKIQSDKVLGISSKIQINFCGNSVTSSLVQIKDNSKQKIQQNKKIMQKILEKIDKKDQNQNKFQNSRKNSIVSPRSESNQTDQNTSFNIQKKEYEQNTKDFIAKHLQLLQNRNNVNSKRSIDDSNLQNLIKSTYKNNFHNQKQEQIKKKNRQNIQSQQFYDSPFQKMNTRNLSVPNLSDDSNLQNLIKQSQKDNIHYYKQEKIQKKDRKYNQSQCFNTPTSKIITNQSVPNLSYSSSYINIK